MPELLTDACGIEYYTELPEGYIQAKHWLDLYRVKKTKRKWMEYDLKTTPWETLLPVIKKFLAKYFAMWLLNTEQGILKAASQNKKLILEIVDVWEGKESEDGILELNYGIDYVVFSPQSKKYFKKNLHLLSNCRNIALYIQDKNLYYLKPTL